MNSKFSTAFIAKTGLLSGFAIIISYIESLLPINIGIPGIKPGLANIVIVIALYLLNWQSAIIINIIRVLIVGMFFGNVFSILFSLAGALVSFLCMFWVKKIKDVNMVTVSVCGGVSHNIAQIFVAALVVETYSITYYLPFLILGGVITGLIIGVVSDIIYSRVVNIDL